MALLLCLDTALETAIVAIGNADGVVASQSNHDQKTHGAFVQPAIAQVMKQAGIAFHQLDGVALVNGPGSYTGLRVGLSSAKGICYAAGKPLLLLNTLEVMAAAAVQTVANPDWLYCPMIDARRNEVFTAVYNFDLEPVFEPTPLVVEENSFESLLASQKLCLFGSGHNKCKKIITHKNAYYTEIFYKPDHINNLTQDHFLRSKFANVAYSEPYYMKEFYNPVV